MPARKTLVFVVTEDWFFASHFLPMLRAAQRAGFDPIVLTRVRQHASVIEAAGGRVIPFEADRGSLDPFAIVRSVFGMARILRRERATVVHAIALRSIVVGGAAARLARVPAILFAVTGGGFLTARSDSTGSGLTRLLALLVRRGLARSDTQFLFENEDDPRRFGMQPNNGSVTIVGGAGVDPDYYEPTTERRPGPLRIALVSRMLWSKGADLAVEAATLARIQGAEVELSLFGAPDPLNPRAVPEETLREWSAREGITWHGATQDVRKVWADHDIACLPSRGGEGLPRMLLEAAASERALVTTEVAGCRSFVRDGLDGIVVPPNDPIALANAFLRLATDRSLVERMGQSARRRVVEDGYTEEAVATVVERLYTRMVSA